MVCFYFLLFVLSYLFVYCHLLTVLYQRYLYVYSHTIWWVKWPPTIKHSVFSLSLSFSVLS